MYMYCMRSDSELGSEYVSGAVSESPVIVELSVAYVIHVQRRALQLQTSTLADSHVLTLNNACRPMYIARISNE